MGLQAVFAGPDDSDTCDTPNGGCDGAVNDGPYPVDLVPEPGSFDCGVNCRHIVQLIGDDESDDGETFTYVGSVGFVEGPHEDKKLTTPDHDAVVVAGEEPNQTAIIVGKEDDDDDLSPLERMRREYEERHAAEQTEAPENNPYDTLIGDMPALEDWAEIIGPDADALADWAFQTGENPNLIISLLALDPQESAALLAAYDALLGSNLTVDFALKLLAAGDVEQLATLAQNSDAFKVLLQNMASNGFDDHQASYAYLIAEALGGTAKLDSSGMWTVVFREAMREVGGPGSGDFGHADVPGKRGGSAPSTRAKKYKKVFDKVAKGDYTFMTETKYVASPASLPIEDQNIVTSTVDGELKATPLLKESLLQVGASGHIGLEDGTIIDSTFDGITFPGTYGRASVFINPRGLNDFKSQVKEMGGYAAMNARLTANGDGSVGEMHAQSFEEYEAMTTQHEMGHVYEFALDAATDGESERDWGNAMTANRDTQGRVIEPISGYADGNKYEYFAEAYLAYRRGYPMSQWIKAFFDKYAGMKLTLPTPPSKVKKTESDVSADVVAIACDIHHGKSTLIYSDGTSVTNTTKLKEVGTASSGDHGHLGRKGEVGGSLPNAFADKTMLKVAHDFMNSWIESSGDDVAHYLQMVANEANGLDRYANLVTSYRTREMLEKEYDLCAKMVDPPDLAKAYVQQTEKDSEQKFDAAHPNGQTIYRGIGRLEYDALNTLPLGGTVQFRPLMSVSENAGSAAYFGVANLEFEEVKGHDVFSSYDFRDTPTGSILNHMGEDETVMRGNVHDWVVVEKTDGRLRNTIKLAPAPLSPHYQNVLRHNQITMKEADATPRRTIIIHSNMDFGSKTLIEEGVTYADGLTEVGNANSGDHGHADVPGKRGGSAPSTKYTTLFDGTRGARLPLAVTEDILSPEAVANGLTVKDITSELVLMPMPKAMQKAVLAAVDANIEALPEQANHLEAVVSAGAEEDFVHGEPSGLDDEWDGMTTMDSNKRATLAFSPLMLRADYNGIVKNHLNGGTISDFTTPQTFSEYAREVVTHEMGHVYELSQSAEFQKSVADLYAANKNSVTRYGSTNSHEFFAEAFSAYMTDNAELLNAPVRAFMEKTLGKNTRLKESSQPQQTHVVSIRCNFGALRSTVVYSDGTRTVNTAPLKEVGGPGSGDFGHADVPGKRGGSAPSTGEKDEPGKHVKKISEEPGIHTFNFPNSNDYVNYRGFPTDTRIKNQILGEVDKNIEQILGQPAEMDEVFFADQMEAQLGNRVQSLPAAVGITLNGLEPLKVIGFNSKAIAFHDFDKSTFSVADILGRSTSSYARLVADHEMGHVNFNQMSGRDQVRWNDTWNAQQNDIQSTPFTRYSASNVHEGYAEAYAAYVNNYPMPDRFKAFMDYHLKGTKLHEASSDPIEQPIAICCGFGDAPTYHIYHDHVQTFYPGGRT